MSEFDQENHRIEAIQNISRHKFYAVLTFTDTEPSEASCLSNLGYRAIQLLREAADRLEAQVKAEEAH